MKKEENALPKGVRFIRNGYEARKTVNGVAICMRDKDLGQLLKKFEQRIHEVQAQDSMNAIGLSIKTTLNDFFDYWFDTAKVLELKGEGSAKVLKRKFQRTFSFYIGYKTVHSILPIDVQAAVNAMKTSNVGISTILDAFSLLRQCFDFAKANRIIPSNPCEAVILPKKLCRS